MLYIASPRKCAPPILGVTASHCVCTTDNCRGVQIQLRDQEGNPLRATVLDALRPKPCSAAMAHLCAVGEAWACRSVNRVDWALIDYVQKPPREYKSYIGVAMSVAVPRLYAWLARYAPKQPQGIQPVDPQPGQRVVFYALRCVEDSCSVAEVRAVISRVHFVSVVEHANTYCFYPVAEIILPRDVVLDYARYVFSGAMIFPDT